MPRFSRNGDADFAVTNEHFVLVNENRFAHAAISRLVKAKSGDPLSLVLLHGPAGIGKSHLVRYFVRESRRHEPRPRLKAEATSAFVAAVNEATSRKEQAELHADYAATDLLILEDFAAIDGRDAAQRLLIVLLDDLKRSGGRVVITCNSLPGQLKDVLPRLSNRLRGGLCVPLELLDEAGRRSFVQNLAASRQIPVSSEAAELLSREGPATPREILAALLNLEIGSRQGRPATDASLVRAQLKSNRSSTDCSLHQVAQGVCEFFDVSLPQLRSSSRQKRLDLPRQVAMFLSRELTSRPTAAIAKFFGRKNHTTVVHACRRTRTLVKTDPTLARDLEKLRRSLRRP